jgi:hypothetical protein
LLERQLRPAEYCVQGIAHSSWRGGECVLQSL